MNDDLYHKIEDLVGITNSKLIDQRLKQPRRDRGEAAPRIDVHTKGSVYQADLIRLPDDQEFKYALVVVDTYDRSMDAEPMKSTKAKEAKAAIIKIFKRKYLDAPILMLQVDNGVEFKADFARYIENDLKIILKRGKPYRSRQQALVERYNYVIARAVARYQLVREEVTEQLSTEWIDYLPKIVRVINEELVRPNPRHRPNLS
eukprot:m.5465 g.5465  ORF g.5465 m.5465 type:complete len:203 (-) comp7693_c0_seq1:409-1017(-)